MYTNPNGITGKTTSIRAIIEANKIDILIAAETKTKRPPKIEGYTWIHKPRIDNKGGGIGFLIRNELYNNTIIPDEQTTTNNTTELLWIKTRGKEPLYL